MKLSEPAKFVLHLAVAAITGPIVMSAIILWTAYVWRVAQWIGESIIP